MTTHPEDAMTREQVLEEALRKTASVLKRRANASAWHNDPLIYDTIRDVVEPALASTTQEPARKYGPTEWPEQLLREIYPSPGSPADLANREPEGGAR